MTPRRAQAVTILLGVVFLAVAAIMLVVVPADAVGALRWGIGLPFLVIGLANLALAPRFSREVLPDDGQFQPLDAQGRPVVGSPHVQQLALALDRELRDTPHRIETAPDAVRAFYDSGVFYQPGSRTLRQFRWRTTLMSTPNPTAFVRLDQQVDQTRGGYWGRARVQGGLQFNTSTRVTVGGGKTVKRTVSTGDVSDALTTALKQCGVTAAQSAMFWVGVTNASLGVLVTIGVVLSVLVG